MTIAVLGEALIDLIAGESHGYTAHLGGSPFNVAVALARQGVDVSYLSPFSDDSFGDQLRTRLVEEGVRLPLARRSGWPTSLALITLDTKGQPTYRLYREGVADKDISVEEILEHIPTQLSAFHTGSLAITPSQLPKIRRVLESLRARNVLVSIDINIRLRGSIDVSRYLEGVRSLLSLADIVKASDEDLAAFSIDPDVRRSAETVFEELNGGILVLTEGHGGTLLFDHRGRIHKRAYPIASVADTIGAGDSFHAAFLASLQRLGALHHPPGSIDFEALDESLEYACAAAAINVSRVGCSPPSHREVTEFMDAVRR